MIEVAPVAEGSVLLNCNAVCVLKSSTSVVYLIDCSTQLQNTGITRSVSNIPQPPFMLALLCYTVKWLKIKKLELAAELASEPE